MPMSRDLWQISRLDKNLFTEEISKDLEEYSWANLGKRILGIIAP